MSVTTSDHPHTHRNIRLPVAIAAVIVLVLLALWAYLATRPTSAIVARRDIVVYVPLTGKVVAPPDAHASVIAPYAAPVSRIYASVGQRVNRGEVLVELNLPTAQTAYDQARQELRAAQIAYQNAQRQLSAPVAAARAQLAAARATERAARQAAAGPPPGYGAGPSTDQDDSATVQESAPDLSSATADRMAAEQNLAQAQADAQTGLIPYQQRLDAARQSLAEAQSGRKMALIRAPIAGTVLALNAQPNAVVGEDRKTPIATIVNLDGLQVQAPIPSDKATEVRPGDSAILSFGDIPNDTFNGKALRITTQLSGPLKQQQYVALVSVDNKNGVVKPDLEADVSIRVAGANDVLAVPTEAIDQDSTGRPVVKVLSEGRWHDTVVEIGISDGHYTEIKSGLQEGDMVQVRRRLL